ncbi:hypothetical protein FOCC_FOCC001545 [Frankliniella occidentalis]|nr:hypothetical protein FOCC_FOCC001545 [Frankliniella occidentalis]
MAADNNNIGLSAREILQLQMNDYRYHYMFTTFFDNGKRSNVKLDLLKLKHSKLRRVGQWVSGKGINITDPTAFYGQQRTNITLVVMTRQEKPYVMLKEDRNLTGNARFEGFCIDLLKWIAHQVGFHYAIRLVPDHMYGVCEGGLGRGLHDHQLRQGERHRLYETVHEPRHRDPVQGPDVPADATVLLHEPAGGGDLDLRAGRVPPGQLHAVRDGALLALRVEHGAQLHGPRAARGGAQPVLRLQQLLVHHGHLPAPGLRSQPQGDLDAHRGRHLVVLHAHHHLLVHGQPGRLPHRRADDHAHRERRRPGGPDRDLVRHLGGRLHHDVLQEDVAIHGEQEALRVRLDLRGGSEACAPGELRLPHGVHHAGLRGAAGLQPDADRRPPGLQRLRHRHPERVALEGQDLAGHPGAAGEGRDPDARSLCSEMGEELRFALRCFGPRQRPAVKRCHTCHHMTPSYVPGTSIDLQTFQLHGQGEAHGGGGHGGLAHGLLQPHHGPPSPLSHAMEMVTFQPS